MVVDKTRLADHWACIFNMVIAEHRRQFDEWMTDTLRPHVPPFLLECVQQRKSLRLAARYLDLKKFRLEFRADGVLALCKSARVLGTFRFKAYDNY